ncbi:MAG: leucyl aminopeptidase [Thermus sp.]|uniref:leucyl aminopeptidase n=1 Tax=Thermus sp. TaxID=275 RepID=UPI0025DB4AAA|nr:leucyl aminopeptidase [Thermus sp.]MCS7217397.1 leucyl aminopeptidase [Thermus sp.]MCX7848742.1 leucyl aminopeptidase [Thermus sp.]MDW8357474.1 leucyl aminopeptidase [Thermus sp.]
MITLHAAEAPLWQAQVPLKVLWVRQGKLSPQGEALDARLEGLLRRAWEGAGLKGESGESLLLATPEGHFLLVAADGDARQAGGRLAQLLGRYAFLEALVEPLEDGYALAEGLWLGAYRFLRYKGQPGERPLALHLLGVEEGVLERARKVAEGVYFARDLVNEPPNVLTPEALAEAALALRPLGVEVEVLDEEAIAALGMGAFLAVAQGSANPPRFIQLRYRPEGARGRLDLVGKGLTFDSGGYSLKPTEGMAAMKGDMAGAAAVLGAFKAAALLGLPVELWGYIAACENLISGRAYRVGDVLKTLSGKTVEVMNTDAEGRLTLADALAYAERQGAERILELSTLTGAAVVALGEEVAALFATEAAWGERVRQAAQRAGEKVWPMPLEAAYREKLKSPVADLKNVGDRSGGAITAALFLAEFVRVPLVHLDIAGPAFAKKAHALGPEGGTGFGVRTILEVAQDL